MGEPARRRVDEVLERIAGSMASGGVQVLPLGAAERRSAARSEAERLARASDRVALAREGRDTVRAALDARYAQFNVGMVYGTSSDLSTARDRVEIAIALEDLVLATAVEDLLPPDDFAALATDGASLLAELPSARMFPSVSYAPASGASTAPVRVMQVTVVGVLIVGSIVAGFVFGIVPALFGGCLAAAIVASWIWRPRGDAEAQESDTP